MPQLQSETWVMTRNFKHQAETPPFLNRSPSLVSPTELLVIVLKEETALVCLVIPSVFCCTFFSLRRKLLLLSLVSEMVTRSRAPLVSFAPGGVLEQLPGAGVWLHPHRWESTTFCFQTGPSLPKRHTATSLVCTTESRLCFSFLFQPEVAVQVQSPHK